MSMASKANDRAEIAAAMAKFGGEIAQQPDQVAIPVRGYGTHVIGATRSFAIIGEGEEIRKRRMESGMFRKKPTSDIGKKAQIKRINKKIKRNQRRAEINAALCKEKLETI